MSGVVSTFAFAVAMWSITVTVVPPADFANAKAFLLEAWHHFVSNPPLAIGVIFAPFAYVLAADFFRK